MSVIKVQPTQAPVRPLASTTPTSIPAIVLATIRAASTARKELSDSATNNTTNGPNVPTYNNKDDIARTDSSAAAVLSKFASSNYIGSHIKKRKADDTVVSHSVATSSTPSTIPSTNIKVRQ